MNGPANSLGGKANQPKPFLISAVENVVLRFCVPLIGKSSSSTHAAALESPRNSSNRPVVDATHPHAWFLPLASSH